MKGLLLVSLSWVVSCSKPAPPGGTIEASVEARPACVDVIQARPGVVLGTAHVKVSGDRVVDEPAAAALCTTSDVQHWLVPERGVVFAACTRAGLITLTLTDRTLGHVDFSKGGWGGSNLAYPERGLRVFSFVDDPTKDLELGHEHTKARMTFDGALVEVDWTCRFEEGPAK